jgi:DNA-binding LacI/PurR family transcriptional regulator
MSKQTAVEWLIEEMHKNIVFIPVPMQEKAKEMEKEQIINSFKEGHLYHGFAFKREPELYYAERFGKEEK